MYATGHAWPPADSLLLQQYTLTTHTDLQTDNIHKQRSRLTPYRKPEDMIKTRL